MTSHVRHSEQGSDCLVDRCISNIFLILAYPFLDVAALMEHLHISGYSAIRHILQKFAPPPILSSIYFPFGRTLFLLPSTWPSNINLSSLDITNESFINTAYCVSNVKSSKLEHCVK